MRVTFECQNGTRIIFFNDHVVDLLVSGIFFQRFTIDEFYKILLAERRRRNKEHHP